MPYLIKIAFSRKQKEKVENSILFWRSFLSLWDKSMLYIFSKLEKFIYLLVKASIERETRTKTKTQKFEDFQLKTFFGW